MSDALRMIKKEFGEEAVILSAKNLSKTSRIFGKRVGGKVIVTAAIDEALPEDEGHANETDTSWALPDFSSEAEATAHPEETEINNVLERYTPITRTGRQKLHAKLVRLGSELKETQAPAGDDDEASLYPVLRKQGLDDEIAAELAMLSSKTMLPDDETPCSPDALAQAIQTKTWIAPGGTLRQKGRRIIVLVGPCRRSGAG